MISERQLHEIHENGFTVVENVLTVAELEAARHVLDEAIQRTKDAGRPLHYAFLDPNASNIRVNHLAVMDKLFIDLLRHPVARQMVQHVLDENAIVSNFTANIALPGARPMKLHSDQALTMPPPWNEAWAFNVVWCLDEVDAENGATQYIPGSHRYRSFDDVPANAEELLRPFEAPAGSFVAMEGRLWHTSGSNTSKDRQRRLLFAYYGMDFIRPQINWEAVVSPEFRKTLDADACRMLGLGSLGNGRIGYNVTRLDGA